MEKTNFTVARVVTHTRAGVGKCERHNERKNENYGNMNVVLERIPMNVHFKACGELTYNETLDKLVANGVVSLRGLKENAKVYDEMILDVNTDYFERHGGYKFAREFYEEAYRFAYKLYGERNILSAVMHADEINLALTEKYGRPVYHYHLHIVALPVVEKQVLWSKRCRDKALVGTVKETVQQVSHSKKWKSQRALDEQGKPAFDDKGRPKLIPSYSILQDEFCRHMQEAGFTDFIRGERGSTADNLSNLQYQIKKDTERLEAIQEKIRAEEAEYAVIHPVYKTHAEIDEMGRKTLTGKITVSQDDFDTLTQLAKEGVSGRGQLNRLKEENRQLQAKIWSLQGSLNRLQGQFNELAERCRPYLEAVRFMPEKVKELLDSVLAPLRKHQEEQGRSIMYVKGKSQESRGDIR
ncbi:plasmid recombination protein [Anaerotruncus colihominis]|uniref:plasmid recombination protein n=1 Tax=Anaerotruncus colihominis TaxID=169435 RepID=UPI0035141EDC